MNMYDSCATQRRKGERERGTVSGCVDADADVYSMSEK